MGIIEAAKSALGLTSDLSAASYATRRDALAARRLELDETLEKRRRELAKLEEAAREQHRASLVAAELEAETVRIARASANLARFYESAAPLVAAWVEEPTRRVSEELRELLTMASDVALEETGDPLLSCALAFVFADIERAKRPGIEHALAHGFGSVHTLESLRRAACAVKPSLSAGDFFQALGTLERAIGRIPARPDACGEYTVRCFEIAKAGPSDRDALTDHEAASRAADEARAREASKAFVPRVKGGVYDKEMNLVHAPRSPRARRGAIDGADAPGDVATGTK